MLAMNHKFNKGDVIISTYRGEKSRIGVVIEWFSSLRFPSAYRILWIDHIDIRFADAPTTDKSFRLI